MTGRSSSLPGLPTQAAYGFAHSDVLDKHASMNPFLSFDKYYFYSNTLTRTHGRSRPAQREVVRNAFQDLSSVRSEREAKVDAVPFDAEMRLPKWGTHCHVGISSQARTDYGNNISQVAETWWKATEKPVQSKP